MSVILQGELGDSDECDDFCIILLGSSASSYLSHLKYIDDLSLIIYLFKLPSINCPFF